MAWLAMAPRPGAAGALHARPAGWQPPGILVLVMLMAVANAASSSRTGLVAAGNGGADVGGLGALAAPGRTHRAAGGPARLWRGGIRVAPAGRAGPLVQRHRRPPAGRRAGLPEPADPVEQRAAPHHRTALDGLGLGCAGPGPFHGRVPRPPLLRHPGQRPQPAAAPGGGTGHSGGGAGVWPAGRLGVAQPALAGDQTRCVSWPGRCWHWWPCTACSNIRCGMARSRSPVALRSACCGRPAHGALAEPAPVQGRPHCRAGPRGRGPWPLRWHCCWSPPPTPPGTTAG
jgi:hypothetical protein